MAPNQGSLRPMTREDLLRVLAWRNHPDIRSVMLNRHEISLAEHRAWFERASCDPTKRLLIFDEGGNALGFVSFTGIRGGGIADWGFYTAPDAAKGTGRRLGISALNLGFGEIGLHKICGQALAFNEASIRFHRMLGFRQEGILREQHFDGRHFRDLICFGLLRQEWHPTLSD